MLKTVRRPESDVDGGLSEPGPTSEPDSLSLRLAGVGWGLFFIWVAALFIGALPTSIGLLGIAVITLGMQATRKALGLAAEGFWLVVGLGFLLAAVWEILDPGLPLIAALLLLLGVALLASAVRRRG